MLTDLEIAQQAEILPVKEIAKKLGLNEDEAVVKVKKITNDF